MNLGDRIKAAVLLRALLAAVQWVAKQLGWRAPPPDPHTSDLSPADRAETFTKRIPPKPKKRTAKRGPVPPESLSGGQ